MDIELYNLSDNSDNDNDNDIKYKTKHWSKHYIINLQIV